MPQVQYSRSSVYAQTPQNNFALGYWQPPNLAPSVSDQFLVLSQKYRHRPDLLSFDLYGTPRLWWVFQMINPDVIRDPIYDMQPGIELRAPSNTSIQGYL
jgi:hypothetical protein